MDEETEGAQVLVDALVEQGVEYMFGVSKLLLLQCRKRIDSAIVCDNVDTVFGLFKAVV